MRSLEVAMYPPPELVAKAGPFGGADLAQQRGTVAELAQICQTWGATLAVLHTTATHGPSAPLAARPWMINPERRPAAMRPGSMSKASMRSVLADLGHAAVLRAYESSYELRAAVREVDERWTELHWIHGNLTATNVLVQHQPALRVSFIDPYGVGLGDPAWDLAAAVDMIIWLAPCWGATPQLLADYLILGYRRAGGPGHLYPAIQAVRALATAVWVADPPYESSSEAPVEGKLEFWLDRACGYAARVGCLMSVA
jgi:aminoglycoside phosphotransferase (APT) family kinase protein